MATMYTLFFGFGLVLLLVLLAVAIASYVAYAIPLYQMAVSAGLENAWLAWIPIAQIYTLCMLSKNECVIFGQIRFSKRQNAFWAFLIVLLAGRVLVAIPLLGGLISLASWVASVILMWKFNYDLLRTYRKDNSSAMAMSIIGTIVSIVMIVMLWMIRKEEPDYTYMG